ncbi:hypothetical protein PR003_g11483 [Phytophthora rubi]|uniref:RxLR effector protein n=1 Tax=Phytophthora rubi TaxID=129364 RepID=A0A6A4FAP4_9STRA|nr:hypothetical protein PR001_g11063 [Phytophthora rubi]KAE9338463.1 hypothetical protein PR003_g11483 [Phytophthora rubi]
MKKSRIVVLDAIIILCIQAISNNQKNILQLHLETHPVLDSNLFCSCHQESIHQVHHHFSRSPRFNRLQC